MGEKGAKLTGASVAAAEHLVDALAPLGAVRSKKMFGGHGIFCDDVMFAIVDSTGTPFLRVDDATRPAFEQAGSEAHGRMPYQSIPGDVVVDDGRLVEWARAALTVAQAAKR